MCAKDKPTKGTLLPRGVHLRVVTGDLVVIWNCPVFYDKTPGDIFIHVELVANDVV